MEKTNLGKFYPRILKKKSKEMLIFAGIKTKPEKFITNSLIFGFVFSLVIALILRFIFKVPFLVLTFLVLLIILNIVPYLWLILQVDKRSYFIQNILPDALQLMASNLRAGLTTDRALLLSARPEFGTFKDEINILGKQITLGKDIGDSLLEMTTRIKSKKVERTIELIVAGLRSGGKLASLLEETASDLRRQKIIEQKIRSNVNMYVIFIFIAVAVGSPILFGLSSFLVEVLKESTSNISIPEGAFQASAISLNVAEVKISTTFILLYILTFLTVSSVLGGLLMGLISKGKEKEGLKIIPILLFLTFSIFFLVRFILTNVVGKLFL